MKTPADSPEAHVIHLEAEKTREKDKLNSALELYTKAIALYEKDQNFTGIAQAYLGVFLTYKHLYLLSKSEEDAKKAYEAIYASEKIVKNYDITHLLPVIEFEIGSWFQMQEKYDDAALHFQNALDTSVGSPAEKGDYRYHVGYAQYKTGKKDEGKEHMLKGLEEIRLNGFEVDPFIAHVWESGALMSLAECLWEDARSEAVEYLHEAERVIHDDPRLVIRQRQVNTLKKKLGIAG